MLWSENEPLVAGEVKIVLTESGADTLLRNGDESIERYHYDPLRSLLEFGIEVEGRQSGYGIQSLAPMSSVRIRSASVFLAKHRSRGCESVFPCSSKHSARSLADKLWRRHR